MEVDKLSVQNSKNVSSSQRAAPGKTSGCQNAGCCVSQSVDSRTSCRLRHTCSHQSPSPASCAAAGLQVSVIERLNGLFYCAYQFLINYSSDTLALIA